MTLNPAPAVNETLTPDDAVDVLEELQPAQNKSYELGLKLKLPQHVVEAIHSKELPPDKYLLKIIIKFLHQVEPRPTWRVIVEALKSPIVDLPALARRVKAAHFPDTTARSDVVAETPGMSLSATPLTLLYSHVSIISVTEHAASTNGDDDEVKSKIPSQLSPTTGGSEYNNCNAHFPSTAYMALGTAKEVQSHAANLSPLAKRVAATHFPDTTTTSGVVVETTGMSLSATPPCLVIVMSL